MHSQGRKSNRRVILALECGGMGHNIQKEALRACVHLASQLDILLVDPPEDGASLPALLLLQLEHSGIDYRLAQTNTPLSDAVVRYLNRNRQPVTLIVADAARLSENCRGILAAGGHRLIDLAHPHDEDTPFTPANTDF